MWVELAKVFQQGDMYLYIMSGISCLGFIVFFERVITLQFSYNVNARKFMTELRKMILAEDYVRAETLCKSAGKNALPQISLKAVETMQTDPSRVRGMIEEETIDFIPKIEARIHFLPTLASMTLLIGILATIHGVWDAFHSLEVLDNAQKQLALGNGLAASLNYTCYGLIIGSLFVLLHYFVKSLAIKVTDRLNYGVTALGNLLAPNAVMFAAAGPAPASLAAGSDSGETTNDLDDDGDTEIVEDEPAAIEEDAADDEVDDIKDEEEII